MLHQGRVDAHLDQVGHHLALTALDILDRKKGWQGRVLAKVVLVDADPCPFSYLPPYARRKDVGASGQADVGFGHGCPNLKPAQGPAHGQSIQNRAAGAVQKNGRRRGRLCLKPFGQPVGVPVGDGACQCKGGPTVPVCRVKGQSAGHVLSGRDGPGTRRRGAQGQIARRIAPRLVARPRRFGHPRRG